MGCLTVSWVTDLVEARKKCNFIIFDRFTELSMILTLPIEIPIYAGITFLIIIIWTFRCSGSVEEYERNIETGEKIGWRK
jgi:hypothetical protein